MYQFSFQEIWYPGEKFLPLSQSTKGVYSHSQHHSVDLMNQGPSFQVDYYDGREA
jgi:hypothetical protein